MTFKVVVTGASGVLGTAIFDAFQASELRHQVLGLAHTSDVPGFKKVDLLRLDEPDVKSVFTDFAPQWVIHCAAERRPDVAEKDPKGVQKLNVEVPEKLALLSKSLNFTLIYISTDYVFDGTSPPYAPSAPTNPLQYYGKTKRDGELAVLGVEGAKAIVLRVPVLYGPTRRNSDSAINILLDVVQDQSGKKYKMDHYATRYPTNVTDIASFLVQLSTLTKPIPPILHFSADESFTKYEICIILAHVLGLPHNHIVPDDQLPSGEAGANRPRDCRLYTGETERLLDREGLGCTFFEGWWRAYLSEARTK